MIPSAVTITHRKLTPREAQILHEELKSTPNILGFTVRELRNMRDVHVAEADGTFAGAALSMDLPFRWTDIAAVYVLPGFRRLGIGDGLLRAAWDCAVNRNRRLYMLSRNAAVVVWMRAQGMVISKYIVTAPLAVHLWMPIYMTSWHRTKESFRKSREIQKCPELVQGVCKNPRLSVGRVEA